MKNNLFYNFLNASNNQLLCDLFKARIISKDADLNKNSKDLKQSEIVSLVMMSVFLKENDEITNKQFLNMLADERLADFKSIADKYKGDDITSVIRTLGGIKTAEIINKQQKQEKQNNQSFNENTFF